MIAATALLCLAGLFTNTVAGYAVGEAESCESILYFLNNDPSGAEIVAVCTSGMENSMLKSFTKTSTGGKGLQGIGTGGPGGPDSLYSQGSVAVYGNFLFTVNAGSNTAVMFDITYPMAPEMVGKPMSTLGDFPLSITYSYEMAMACVINGGKVAGVACYSVDPVKGLSLMDKTLRALPSTFSQTTPPHGPGGTASQVSFTPDNAFLVATIKGPVSGGPGDITVWPVSDGAVSHTATTSTFPGDDTPFGFGFLGSEKNYQILVSDPTAGVGAYTLNVNSKTGAVTKAANIGNIGTLAAPCWGTNDPSMNYGFLMDAAKPQIAMWKYPSTNATVVPIPAGATGAFDAYAGPNNLFILSASASIAVIDIHNPTKAGLVNLTSVGPRTYWEGMQRYNS